MKLSLVPSSLLLLCLCSGAAAALELPQSVLTGDYQKPPSSLLRRPTNTKQDRELQDNSDDNPCTVPFEDVFYGLVGGGLFVPSYLSSCLRSLSVNGTLMTQHIEALRATFEDYFCFYDLANDAAASDPLSYTPELGYTLFTGEEEGQVNLEEELTALLDSVANDGASIGTFWDIQTIFNKLRDAHVYAFKVAGPAGTLSYSAVFVFPQRALNPEGPMTVVNWDPTYTDEGELKLTVGFADAGGAITEEVITSIDGMAPLDWYHSLTSNPSISFPYQSVGARLNAAFQALKALGGSFAFALEGHGMPPDVFPDQFAVTYESGNEEIYISAAAILDGTATPAPGWWNATLFYDYVNSEPVFEEAGPAYKNFEIALFQVINATSDDVQQMAEAETKKISDTDTNKPKTKAGHTGGGFYEWDDVFTVQKTDGTGPMQVGAYRITDEYAVFKLQTFYYFQDLNGKTATPEMWSNFTKAAKARGVKKALIDVSGNGGGSVIECLSLVASLYPFAPFSVFEKTFDITYNDVMLAYNNSIDPILDILEEAVKNTSDAELQEYLQTLPDGTGDQLEAVGSALLQFCCQPNNVTECEVNPERKHCIDTLQHGLIEPILTLQEFPTGPQLRLVLDGIFSSTNRYNPFNVFGVMDGEEVGINEVTRGGQPQNLTDKFGLLQENDYYRFVAQSFQNDWMFDEYTLVGDGTGGSATMLFAGTVMELWNNRDLMWNGRDVPPAPLSTVTFGGSNKPQDTTVAGFPASVQESNIGIPILTAGLILMLEVLLPGELGDLLSLVNEYYTSLLAVPPYFAQVLPSMPVFNFYSNFMDPGAFPMQYIKMFSDRHHHIPQIYTGTNIYSDTSDLKSLYSQAAKLGFSASEKPPPVEDSGDVAFEMGSFDENSRDGGSR